MDKPVIKNSETKMKFSDKIHWGRNVVFGPNCKNIQIGYGCFIGNDIYIDVEELTIGEYVTIHHGSILHGKKCTIGHNCWIGHYSILDALGGKLDIGNNVGVGAQSQLWSHIQFGDLLEGCNWYGRGSLTIGDDAWLVGHCIVSSIQIKPRAMLMVGGVATKDLEENRTYAGTPAVDVTEKLGPQFREISMSEKLEIFNGYVSEFKNNGHDVHFIKITENYLSEPRKEDHTFFDLMKRTYYPRYTEEEFKFMKFLLYQKGKFIPAPRA